MYGRPAGPTRQVDAKVPQPGEGGKVFPLNSSWVAVSLNGKPFSGSTNHIAFTDNVFQKQARGLPVNLVMPNVGFTDPVGQQVLQSSLRIPTLLVPASVRSDVDQIARGNGRQVILDVTYVHNLPEEREHVLARVSRLDSPLHDFEFGR